MTSTPNQAGILKHYLHKWAEITNDPVILSWVSGYKIPFIKKVIQNHLPDQRYNSLESAQIRESINELLTMGAISECLPCKDQYISSVFVTPKANGQFRFILNLKKLNEFVYTEHFKIEDLRTTLKLVNKNYFMCNIDLKDAYFSVPIHEDDRRYLRFKWKGFFYEFNVLPFGLNTAPYVFTKIMRPIFKILRSQGYMSTIYLDDFLLLGDTYQSCLSNVNATVDLLQALGFVINYDKSSLVPNTKCKFLGRIIDSNKMQLYLTDDKRKNIKCMLQKFRNLKVCSIRNFAQLTGLLTSACSGIAYGWLYTKKFERCKYLNLIKSNNNFDRKMTLPNSLQGDFLWWIKSIETAVNYIRKDEYHLEIFSDASKTGWGISCGNETASGLWGKEEASMHINYLELLAAYFGLKIFAKNIINRQILLRIDNVTAISYINRMGGIKFPHLNDLSRNIWHWCESRKLFIYASYIQSKQNTVADTESRKTHPDIEWSLTNNDFNLIVNKFGIPDIDLFASRINKKCDLYISWHRDPDAHAIDAFTVPWNDINFYAFPPFSLILKVLDKIVSDRAEGIIVVPLWPTQPWYPLFKKLLISDLMTISQCSFFSPYRSRSIERNTTLVSGILSGRLS